MTDPKRLTSNNEPSMSWVMMNAVLYVLSGVTQPILMAYAQHAGLADPRCQLYMLFYYIGPAAVAVSLRRRPKKGDKQHVATNEDVALLSSSKQEQLSNGNDGNGNGNASASSNNLQSNGSVQDDDSNSNTYGAVMSYHPKETEDQEQFYWPNQSLLTKASGIAAFDIFAQSMTYTGNNLAGPTIFSIIYSSVTIWAALYSKLLLSRSMSKPQWMGVFLVVLGLSLTAVDSKAMGESIFIGATLILVGSSFHGATYVLSEMIMTAPSSPTSKANNDVLDATTSALVKSDTFTTNTNVPLQKQQQQISEPQHISVRANCAIQGIVATLLLLLWQIVYTLPHLQQLILTPMAEAGTSPLQAMTILGIITVANLIHSITFFATLKHFPGGATSAGVLKGLQAVLVFGASAMVLCHRWGGLEMCWSSTKGLSLVVVVCGILLYGMFTEKHGDQDGGKKKKDDDEWYSRKGLLSTRPKEKEGYKSVHEDEEDGRIMCV
eukprot:CAMPEP_0183727148 /NCGR_PEP_ID=MMETSP0737-20130205/24963_1 /TAXON_ID=385413 /ORGANISM="Thalassiosira miniscula, Strain CCMP1093" /LENGTH=492 /DNA_ID=CAMNT_0025958709 /DNA_START=353 /DNA_END=1831 /DNA_ORIENTATION=+